MVGQSPLSLLVQRFNFKFSVDFSKQKSIMGKQEPSAKRTKPVSRVTSLANLLPPVKTAPLKRIGQTLQRSISLRNESRADGAPPPHPPLPSPPPPPPPGSSSSSAVKTRVISATISNPLAPVTASRVSTATAPAYKRRDSKLWSETFDVRLGATQHLSPKDIKRQEAIFELAQGEQDLVEDLKLAKKAYHDPMLKLSIMTEQELNQIFGTLDSLIPLHEDLLSRLQDARKPDGSTEHVGHILTDWLPCLSSYTPYCSNQVKAKALLDQKKLDRRVQDFLQRCLQSPFSRKLDLWNFLDIPRSRLVKYPLLLREILKHTANDHPDRQHLDEAMLMVQSVVADINRRTGESECQYYKDRLLYAEDGQRDELIERSKTLSCHGELKNNRGLKLHVFLFQDVLVITRTVSLNDHLVSYQICRQPIPIRQLDLEDLQDGEMRVGGSIRGAFSNNERTKNFFRVSHHAGGQLQTHYFQASDAFNKQQWINCIRQAKEAAMLSGEQPPPPQTLLCVWGEEMEACMVGVNGERGLRLEKREDEAGLTVDGEIRLVISDMEVDMETGQGGAEQMETAAGAAADCKMEEEGGEGEETHSGGDDDDASITSFPPTAREEKMKEKEEKEQGGAKAEEEAAGMESSDCLQSEEQTQRC